MHCTCKSPEMFRVQTRSTQLWGSSKESLLLPRVCAGACSVSSSKAMSAVMPPPGRLGGRFAEKERGSPWVKRTRDQSRSFRRLLSLSMCVTTDLKRRLQHQTGRKPCQHLPKMEPPSLKDERSHSSEVRVTLTLRRYEKFSDATGFGETLSLSSHPIVSRRTLKKPGVVPLAPKSPRVLALRAHGTGG